LDILLDPEGDVFEIRRLLIDSFDGLVGECPGPAARFLKSDRFSPEIANSEVPARMPRNAEEEPVA